MTIIMNENIEQLIDKSIEKAIGIYTERLEPYLKEIITIQAVHSSDLKTLKSDVIQIKNDLSISMLAIKHLSKERTRVI